MKMLLCSAILLLASAACTHGQSDAGRGVDNVGPYPVAGTGDSCLDASSISEAESEARLGQVRSMKRLYLHYAICTENRMEMLYWMERAALSGSDEMRKALVIELQRSRDPSEAKKARELAKDWGIDSLLQ